LKIGAVSLNREKDKGMHILVTNDDGVMAPGLLALAQAVRPFGKVSILAPDHNWSVSGHSKTLTRPIRIEETELADGSPAFASDGAPSDCVALALLGFFKEPFDAVVSGINPYANLGHDITYSGTVTAAMEAAIYGLPAVAFSMDWPGQHHSYYEGAQKVIQAVMEQVLANGMPKKHLLNVNIPYLPYEQIKGFRVTRQGLRIYHDALVSRQDPRGRPYFWIGGDEPTGIPDDGTDIGELAKGYCTITPIQLDMTAYEMMSTLEAWQWPARP